MFPLVFRFFVATTPHNVQLMADINNYLQFALTLFVAFGVAFETPVAVVLLVLTNLVSLQKLRKARGYVLIIVFVIAAILTPPGCACRRPRWRCRCTCCMRAAFCLPRS